MNTNNGKTGNVNIPGALHSTGGDGDGQVGGVVAYAGDVYDETLGKNQKEINQTLLDGSGDSNVIAVALNDLNEKVEEQEKVTSSGLNDLNDKIDNLGKDLEKTTFSSLNDLNDKIDNLNDKVDNNEKTTASALTDLDEKIDINERVVSASLNDLDDKIGYEIKTINNITDPTKNTYYDLTNSAISTLDITNVSVNNINEVVILFLTSSSCTITALTTQRIVGSTSLANNTVYIMSIIRGVVCIVEAPLYVAP